MATTGKTRIDASYALRKGQWPRHRRAVYSGPFSNADFKKWTYIIAALSQTALSKVAREPSVLENFPVPTNFKYDEFWPKIYLESRSGAPVLSTLLLLDAALHDLKSYSREALSSSYPDFKRLLDELGKEIIKGPPGPPDAAESQHQLPEATTTKRRRVEENTVHDERARDQGLAWTPDTSTRTGAVHERDAAKQMDFLETPISSLDQSSNVVDFTLFEIPHTESMLTNADLAAMQFSHPTNIEDFALSFVPEQLGIHPEPSSCTFPGTVPSSLQSGDHQQIDNDSLRNYNTAVLHHSGSITARQLATPSLTGRYLRHAVAPNTDCDQVSGRTYSKRLRERTS